MAHINTIQFAKKIGALVAEELKTAGINVHDLPEDQRQALGEIMLIATELLTKKMQEFVA